MVTHKTGADRVQLLSVRSALTTPHPRGRPLLGITAVLAGWTWLTDDLGSTSQILSWTVRWWPLMLLGLLLVGGLSFLPLEQENSRTWSAPLTGMAVAVAALLLALAFTLGLLSVSWFRTAAPYVLFATGVTLVLAPNGGHERSETRIVSGASFRRVKIVATSKELTVVHLRIICGRVDLDLSRAQLLSPSEVQLSCLFGAAQVTCPAGIQLQGRTSGARLTLHGLQGQPRFSDLLVVSLLGAFATVSLAAD